MACVYFVFISSQIPDLFHLEHFIENIQPIRIHESRFIGCISSKIPIIHCAYFKLIVLATVLFMAMISKRYTTFSRGKLWNIPFVTCLFFVYTLTSVKVSIGLCVYGDVLTSASDLWDIPWYITESVE